MDEIKTAEAENNEVENKKQELIKLYNEYESKKRFDMCITILDQIKKIN